MMKKSHCLIFVFAVAFAIGGCGESPSGTVSGKVAFGGKPIALGTIVFASAGGQSTSANVRDGVYQAARVPIGPAKIAVYAHPTPPPMRRPDGTLVAGSSQPQQPFVPIPMRYQSANRSGLTFTVVAGQQTFDVALTP